MSAIEKLEKAMEGKSSYKDIIIENQQKKIDKQKEVLDKIKKYITTIDTDYAIGCWNKDDEFVDVKKDILELLEEIE
jgi:hypothetical protein